MKKLLTIVILFLSALPAFAQNVGIGNTNPTEKLEVTGNIKGDTVKPAALKLTTNAGTGKVLTSDATGNATWQPTGNTGFGVWGDCATNGNISEYNPVVGQNLQPVSWFGKSVSISGDYAIVGAPFDYISISSTNIGSVSFYRFDGANWQLMSKVWATSPVNDDDLSFSVAISGSYAVAGMPGYDGVAGQQGLAIIYKLDASGTSWSQFQTITDINGALNDNFGKSVSIDGNQLVVGVPNDNGTFTDQGSAIVYEFNGTSWIQKTKLTDASGAASDAFGTSVSISGDRIIVGAPFDDNVTNANAGSICIFEKTGVVWALMTKNNNGAANDEFGTSVSISGNYVIIGIPNMLVGTNTNQGSVKFLYYDGTSWYNPTTQYLSRASGASGDNFGYSVSMSGNFALVGIPSDDIGSNTSEGSVVLYQRIGNFWQQQQFITDPSGYSNNLIGHAVSIDGISKRFVIGAPYAFNVGKVLFGKVN
jgi:FG-GAP repeat